MDEIIIEAHYFQTLEDEGHPFASRLYISMAGVWPGKNAFLCEILKNNNYFVRRKKMIEPERSKG